MEFLTERDERGVSTICLSKVATGVVQDERSRLASYEKTGMTPEEIVALKAERDAAVRDLETLMLYGERFRCEFCGIDKEWCAGREVCAPKWRRPQKEASGT